MADDQGSQPDPKAFGIIRGGVLGYEGHTYTRPMKPARAILMIHIKGEQGSEIYYLAPKKDLGKLTKKDVQGIEELQRRHPDVYRQVVGSLESFTPVEIKDDNALGRFEFTKVPLGWWCYIAAAYVEDKLYMHTDTMGNNGFDKQDVIHGEEVMNSSDHTIDNVVVPVEDKWKKKVKSPKMPREVKKHSTEEGMDDPEHVKGLRFEEE